MGCHTCLPLSYICSCLLASFLYLPWFAPRNLIRIMKNPLNQSLVQVFNNICTVCSVLCCNQGVRSACCTIGQPSYVGQSLTNDIWLVGTCSDGPCQGPGFDYLPLGAVQSSLPLSCCDRALGDPTPSGFFYNPQLGAVDPSNSSQLALWYPQNRIFQYPGTGRNCSASLPKWQCNIGGQVRSAGRACCSVRAVGHACRGCTVAVQLLH